MKRFMIGLVFALLAIIYACDSEVKQPSENIDEVEGSDAGQDSAAPLCSSDAECSDGLFCNGIEQCNPNAKGADERGCVRAESGPCSDGIGCDEATDQCVACADNDDLDGDNHKSIECGGDDCDDNDPNRYPGNVEVCDDQDHDEDCDATTFGERDVDNDGSYDIECCNIADDGTRNCGDDCDDTTFVRQPMQVEICDGIDNDCDGETDEETNEVNWYLDSDDDGYGQPTDEPLQSCEPPEGYSLKDTDCDDDDAARHPGQIDICDTIDNDCDEATDEDVGCDINITGTFGNEGGELSHYILGRIVLGAEIPADALKKETELSLTQVDAPIAVPKTYEELGPAYDFYASGATFEKDITLILPVVTISITNIIVLYLPDDSASEWLEIVPEEIINGVARIKVRGEGCFQVVVSSGTQEQEKDNGIDAGTDAGVDADADAGDEDAEAGTGGTGGSGGTGGTGDSGGTGGAGGTGGSGGSGGTGGTGGSGGSGGTGGSGGSGGTGGTGGTGGSGGSGGTGGGDVEVFYEDFEAGIGDWYADNGIWEVGTPTSGPNAAHSGDNVAATVLNGDYPYNSSRLVSPSIQLPTIDSNEELRLRFRHWFSFATYGSGQMQVSEETSQGAWSSWSSSLSTYSGSGGGVWSYTSVDLSEYAGKKVKIGFLLSVTGNYYGYGPGWYVDDVSIKIESQAVLNYGDTYTEGFETGIGSWYVDNGSWQIGESTNGPNAAHSGNNVGATVLNGDYPYNSSRLVSPSIQLPAIGSSEELRLRFWNWFSFATYGSGQVQISEQTSPGVWSAWSGSLTTKSGHGGDVWTYTSVDLSAYAGKKVKIGFLLNVTGNYYGYGPGWYVDDISIDVESKVVLNPGDAYAIEFETGIGSWYVDNGTWQVGKPTTGPNAAYSGDNLAATVLDGNYPYNSSRLISPSIQLPSVESGNEIHLRFWHWFSFVTYGSGQVQVSEETSTGVWSSWSSPLSTYSGSGGEVWTYPLVDLSAYGDKKVRIGFLLNVTGNYYGYGPGWYIDDVIVQATN